MIPPSTPWMWMGQTVLLSYCILKVGRLHCHQDTLISIAGYSQKRWSCETFPTGGVKSGVPPKNWTSALSEGDPLTCHIKKGSGYPPFRGIQLPLPPLSPQNWKEVHLPPSPRSIFWDTSQVPEDCLAYHSAQRGSPMPGWAPTVIMLAPGRGAGLGVPALLECETGECVY